MSYLPEYPARVAFAIALLGKQAGLTYREVAEGPAFHEHFPRTKFFLRTVDEAEDPDQALEFKVRNEQSLALQRFPDELSEAERAGLVTRVLRAAAGFELDQQTRDAIAADGCRLLVVDEDQLDSAATDEDIHAASS